MVKSNCKWCGKEMEFRYPSRVRDYCSHECANKASAPIRRTARMVSHICSVCQKEFFVPKSAEKSRKKRGDNIQFCSLKCMGMAMRKRKTVKCKNCGKEFETTRNKFCSVECANDFYKKCAFRKNSKGHLVKKNGYWFENGYKVLYCEGSRPIKEHVRIMENHIGRKLKKGEVVHHINGDKADNRIENLQLMTRGEHSRLHRKKELQEGKELFTSSV